MRPGPAGTIVGIAARCAGTSHLSCSRSPVPVRDPSYGRPVFPCRIAPFRLPTRDDTAAMMGDCRSCGPSQPWDMMRGDIKSPILPASRLYAVMGRAGLQRRSFWTTGPPRVRCRETLAQTAIPVDYRGTHAPCAASPLVMLSSARRMGPGWARQPEPRPRQPPPVQGHAAYVVGRSDTTSCLAAAGSADRCETRDSGCR